MAWRANSRSDPLVERSTTGDGVGGRVETGWTEEHDTGAGLDRERRKSPPCQGEGRGFESRLPLHPSRPEGAFNPSTSQSPTWFGFDSVKRVRPVDNAPVRTFVRQCRRQGPVGTRKDGSVDGPMVPRVVTEVPTALLNDLARWMAWLQLRVRRCRLATPFTSVMALKLSCGQSLQRTLEHYCDSMAASRRRPFGCAISIHTRI